jgi:HAD superfamily hydrolase (TIGR01509 family)
MNEIQAIVFDMDGILIDSEVIWGVARDEFAVENGMTWTKEDQEATMGCNTRAWSRIMVERMNLRERLGMDEAAIAREIKTRMLRKYKEHLPERKGAIAAVRLAATRYKVALATGSPNELAEYVMQATGLDRVFQATMYGDDVTHGKPAPDIYLEVLKKIGVSPRYAIGIEDSGNGIRSLKAAGMGAIAAPGPEFPLPEEVLAMADVRVAEMTEIDLDLIEKVGTLRATDPSQRLN